MENELEEESRPGGKTAYRWKADDFKPKLGKTVMPKN
jgi:hypothetical protein